MNRALGNSAIALGFVSSVLGFLTLVVALVRHKPTHLRLARSYAVGVCLAAVVAVIAMQRALITRDFTVSYVAERGSQRTPALYNVATMWSALEGSILLWVLVLAGYVLFTAHRFRKRLDDPLVAVAIAVQLAVCIFFFVLLLGPANPFGRFEPPLGYDGPGPNPLLQNHPLVVFHPPALYLGYVGFTVPFSFAIAALVTGRVGEGWLVETRRWALTAWGFLTVGIVIGAWWSYEVLGWGGYWAWDPVENASFLPWLCGTAYLHSVMVQERRGMLRVWNLSLLCATFALTIFGTFLTRSGVIASVHAFAEGSVGPLLLGFFALVVLVTVGLIAWRGDLLRRAGQLDGVVSREGAFLFNNLAFAAFAFVVLLGTVFPLVLEATSRQRVSVGSQYFDSMTRPIGLTLLFLMAVAPVLPWRTASPDILRQRLLVPAWMGVSTTVVAVLAGARGLVALVGFTFAGFAAGSAVRHLVLAVRRHSWSGLIGRSSGGMVVHLGVALIALAYVASASYTRSSEFALKPGESATFAGHTITYLGIEVSERPEKLSRVARVQVDNGNIYTPSLNAFRQSGQLIGEPSVRPAVTSDVYLTLVALPDDEQRATLRVLVLPLVSWLWVGGAVIALGTVLALVPTTGRRNHRRPADGMVTSGDAPQPAAVG